MPLGGPHGTIHTIFVDKNGKEQLTGCCHLSYCHYENNSKSWDTNINKSCISIQIQLFHFIEIVYIGGEEGINLKHNS